MESFGRAIGWRWLLFFVVLSFALWGTRPVWESSEARYALAARSMLESGNWLIPTLMGEPHLTKPPVTYWATAGGMALFGVNDWGARFGLSLAFLATILALVDWARVIGRPRRECLGAGLVLATGFFSFAGASTLTTDIYVTCLSTIGVLAGFRVWLGVGSPAIWRTVFWASFGLAFLTKGPPAWIALAALAIVGATAGGPGWWSRGFDRAASWVGRRLAIAPIPQDPPAPAERPMHRLFTAGSVAGLLLLSASWFLALEWQRPGFLTRVIAEEVIGRVATNRFLRDELPRVAMPAIVVAGVFPWVWFWGDVLRSALRRVAGGWLSLTLAERVTIVWLGLGLAIFTASASRLPLYVLPLLVPVALWIGAAVGRSRWMPGFAGARRMAVPALAMWCVALLVVRVIPDHPRSARTHRDIGREFIARVTDGDVHVFGREGERAPWSFSFYSGVPIHRERISRAEVTPHARQLSARYAHVYFITPVNRVDRYLEEGSWKVLARDRALAVLEWRGDATRPQFASVVRPIGTVATAAHSTAAFPTRAAAHSDGATTQTARLEPAR